MKTLKKKLNSSRGATIMMSLLLMLVCMMVGASLLMASASNAGKVKSNKVEQQKYFAVSSALTSVCDTLTADARYVGRYDYTRVESWEKMTTGTDSEGNPVEADVLKSTTHTYTQETPGLLTVDGKDSYTPGTMASALTSLLYGMDDIFSEKFSDADGVAPRTWTFHVADPTAGNGAALTAEDEEDGGSEEEAPVEMPVDITAKLEADGRIVLNAVLADASGKTEYSMSAVLRPAVLVTDPETGESTKQDGLSLLAPDEKLATASSAELAPPTSTTYVDGSRSWTDTYEKTGQSTLPVVWELEYIKKGAVE